ncbi:uncharacterized protein PGTG_18197 [Puccinia graminis f. sp. tritici CRL 75-36-700-3]|uniref:Uncharacterized protein n=1 Tax=Puccinia graminis f. sp. tritici (strain CRL 75-36-700-3 / race SCCL) TaxID=418459 RepID=E3L807_PUCGT|nr:uncharacterized protein PGTG_18197 [Puccinia graminis f. sp. tritici CRL 75-36-700-3]EFP92682.2 hypothetical protein PGTG_18197 [Puccinia graminis f. sp. tritici CRL 75-36-700-3]
MVGPPTEDGQTTDRHTLQGDLKTLDHRRSASQNAWYDARSVFGWANIGIARRCTVRGKHRLIFRTNILDPKAKKKQTNIHDQAVEIVCLCGSPNSLFGTFVRVEQ